MDLLNRWVFRDRQIDFVELEDFKLLGRLFHNLGPLTLNLLNPNALYFSYPVQLVKH